MPIAYDDQSCSSLSTFESYVKASSRDDHGRFDKRYFQKPQQHKSRQWQQQHESPPQEARHEFNVVFEESEQDCDTSATSSTTSAARDTSALDALPKFTSNELRYGPRLGSGQFGVVYEIAYLSLRPSSAKSCSKRQQDSRQRVAAQCCRSACNSPLYAVKSPPPVCKNDEHTRQALRDLETEAHFLARAAPHPNVIRLHGTSRDPVGSKSCFLLMDRLYETLEDRLEFWSAKEVKIRRRIRRSKATMAMAMMSMPWKNNVGDSALGSSSGSGSLQDEWMLSERFSYALDVTSALAHLHSIGIMHRDLKPNNIGFDINGDLRLFDFGLAADLAPDRHYTARAGTVRYMAPENFMGGNYDEKVDVYSFAILLWEMIELRVPFRSVDMASFKGKVVVGGYRPNLKHNRRGSNANSSSSSSKWSKPMMEFITKCWDGSPKDRYSSREAHDELHRLLYLSTSVTPEEVSVAPSRTGTVMSTQSLHGTVSSSSIKRRLFKKSGQASTRNCSSNNSTSTPTSPRRYSCQDRSMTRRT